MLRNYSNSRTLGDNIRLGTLTAFTAGTINIASLLIFLSFTSNVTGHYAILAAEISKGNWTQVAVMGSWIFLFFFGSFLSNFIVINFNKKSKYFAHAMPLVLEILCLFGVGVYGQLYYQKTLEETEVLVAIMLFATGLQNGLTASISNFSVKTTHLTGTTTDLGILVSMFTQKKYRKNGELIGRAKLLMSIMIAYVLGAIFSGLTYYYLEFRVFYVISLCLMIVIGYDAYKIHVRHFNTKYRYNRIYKKPNLFAYLYEKIHGVPKMNKKRKLVFED
ncbi:YoaK family protein [Chryseobacterium tructae]|uniref:YoaK family protein n=1 Tax=Chryseobacterium tructae TaxID=1037380 RepID=A0ABV7XSW0_9FLAO|nr:YoaK family protein [Chryseobacterium tructae]MDN3695660.1 YoaK family protein [Chryseobacterium tructae]